MTGKISDDADRVVDGTEKFAAAVGGVNYGILGSSIATFLRTGMMVSKLTAVNLNSANSDNAIPIVLPVGFTRYVLHKIFVSHASVSLTTATAGVFSSTGGGGSTIVTNAALSSITSTAENNAANLMAMTIALGASNSLNFSTLQFRVGTAQGSAATADVSIIYMPIP